MGVNDVEGKAPSIAEKGVVYNDARSSDEIVYSEGVDHLQRRLNSRQIQMIAIGGSIGTALFVSIGYGLIAGGPGSLLIAFTLYSLFLATINSTMAEMSCFMPVSGAWIRMGSKWVDEAFGFMAGWNFFLYEGFLIPFEISALNLVLTFWSDDIPVWAICLACVVLYAVINLFAVNWYGEAESILTVGKVLLIGIVFLFTFITMVGGNPQHDAYGFRYWNNPGAFAESITTGSLGRFEGFLSALWQAAFTIVGPEYVALLAGEAQAPRRTLKTAYKTMYWRFGIFFIGGALAAGIVVPYDSQTLSDRLNGEGSGTGAASVYVIAVQNMGISVLPHIINALLVTSIFSAGNSYVYCATRTLYALSLDGHAPKVFRKVTKKGIPIYCFLAVQIFPLLSFLAVSGNSTTVLGWFANLTEASQLLDYAFMAIVYLFFYRAMKAQDMSRDMLPYKGWWQPGCAIFGLVAMTFVVTCYGYQTLLPGLWDVGTFFSNYTMVFLCPILFVGWKLLKRTRFVPALEADLVWERPAIDAYEAALVDYEEISVWKTVTRIGGVRKRNVAVGE